MASSSLGYSAHRDYEVGTCFTYQKPGGEKVRIDMVIARGSAVGILGALYRINVGVPEVGR